MPPLDYPLVYALKRARPDLTIIVNGGIASLDEAEAHLQHVDGVMMGRAAYQNPALLADVDARFFGEPAGDVTKRWMPISTMLGAAWRKACRSTP